MGGNPIARALTRPPGVHPARQRAVARQTCHLRPVEAVRGSSRALAARTRKSQMPDRRRVWPRRAVG